MRARGVPVWALGGAVVLVVVAAAAWLARSERSDGDQILFDPSAVSWTEIGAEARGQRVRLWMWGGEAALNEFIDSTVAPAAVEAGVTLERVPMDDPASPVNRLVAEADAGSGDQGAIDLLWINGKNFDQGAQAGLWLGDWVGVLPNAALLDPDDPTLWTDFGVPTRGQEMPWSRAAFVFAHDRARLEVPPGTFAELLDYARANPGRLTYPAPPDFTGSAFVRQAVQALGEDEAFELLAELQPLLWREGRTQPVDQAELDQLFARGEVDLAMSYNPNFVDVGVTRGAFADTVRPYVLDGGALQNVSFLAIPASAPSPQGALVVANLLLSPELQAAKADQVGIPSVLEADLVPSPRQPSPHRLADFGPPLAELPVHRVHRVTAIDRRWLGEVAP